MPKSLSLLLAAAFLGDPSPRPVPAAPVVIIHARDYAYNAPRSIKAGATTFHLVNEGKELHHLAIMKLAPGKTMSQLAGAMKKPGPLPPWITNVGGPNAVIPGGSSDATLTLEPGNYVMLCFVPSPGESAPHVMKGMMKALTVEPDKSLAEGPAPDVTLTLADYGFTLDKPLTAGRHEVKVVNSATQTHEVVLMELAPGKTMLDMGNWVDKEMMKGPPPGRPIGGMSNIDKGRTGTFHVDLKPGHYGMICFLPDAKDGKPHSVHGMVKELTVVAQ